MNYVTSTGHEKKTLFHTRVNSNDQRSDVTLEGRRIESIVLEILYQFVAFFCRTVCLKAQHKKYKIISDHYKTRYQSALLFPYSKRSLINPSFNDLKISVAISSFDQSLCLELLKKSNTDIEDKFQNFDRKGGFCFAMSMDFAHQYLTNNNSNVRLISRAFTEGATQKAECVQRIYNSYLRQDDENLKAEEEYLGELYHKHVQKISDLNKKSLNERKFDESFKQYRIERVKNTNKESCQIVLRAYDLELISEKQWNFNDEKSKDENVNNLKNIFESMPMGVYKLNCGCRHAGAIHQMLYIKESGDQGYLYDPNFCTVIHDEDYLEYNTKAILNQGYKKLTFSGLKLNE